VRIPIRSSRFKRDVKRAGKRGKDIGKLRSLLTLLIEERPLPQGCLDHPLKGDWRDFRDAHIESTGY
jgi:mRNA interferase YafQ